jgi:molybdenum cofactor biosynthesis enzyme MoaA
MKISEKVDKRTHVPLDRFSHRPTFPTDMKIEITSRCNYECKNCGVYLKLRIVGDMQFWLFDKIIKQAVKLGVKEVGLFLLGEPFMLDDLSEYIKRAKDLGVEYTYITTNGSLCTPYNMQAVMDAGLDSLKFSLNAGTQEQYREVTGLDYFEAVLGNIKWFAENRNDKINLSCSCIYNGKYKEELLNLKNEVLKHIEDFYFLPLMNHGGNVVGNHGGNIGRLENHVDNVPCWELFNTSRVTWDGWLTMCSFDHQGDFKIADLKEVKLIDAWNDPKFIDLRKAHLKKDVSETICNRCING